MKVQFFESINIETPRERIYARLGYKKGITKLSAERRKEVNSSIEDALSLIRLKGAGVRIPIKKINLSNVVFSTGNSFKSSIVASLLKDSPEALFMGATAGAEVIEFIREHKDSDLTSAVIYDAVASEVTDVSLGWIIDYFNTQLRREKKKLTKRRVSCGYGDFPMEYQKMIYEILQLDCLGVRITESFFLVPEKSVTAVSGVIDL
ncbi:MAG: methionine synthase [Candidatus Omnitrophica bacterium]|nr:methionine synthase [Candidatus Omnitrophota bacterium]